MNDNRPHVLHVVPQYGWAFEIWAKQVSRFCDGYRHEIVDFGSIRAGDCDVLVPWWWKWLAVGQLDRIRVRRGVVGCLYDSWSWGHTPRGGGLLKVALERMDVLAIANEPFLNALRTKFQRLPPVVICPDCVDTDLFQRQGGYPAEFTALWAGNSRSSPTIVADGDLKGYEMILRACDVAKVPLLRADAAEQVIPHDQMPSFYGQGHVLLVGSKSEGGPRPAAEAAACGCGLVATRVGQIPRLVQHGINGVIVQRSEAALVEGITYMRERMKQNPGIVGQASRRAALMHSAAIVPAAWNTTLGIALHHGRGRK